MSSNAELLNKYSLGNKDAYDEIIARNMGLVYNVVKRFLNRNYEYEDLVQIGSIGLIKAVQKFDFSFNVQFSTYAVPMIIGEIKRFLRDDGMMKISRSIKEKAMKGKRAEEELRRELGRNPSIGEISKRTGIDAEELIEAFESSISPDSLEAETEEGIRIIERLSSDDTEDKIVDQVFLKEALKKLDDREYEIIIMRYFKGKTQSEISKKFGVSQVQISRIEKKALARMRKEAIEILN